MSEFRSILYPTDFSENAQQIMPWAVMLARAHGAAVSVLHVAHVTSITSLPLETQEQIADRLATVEAAIGAEGVDVRSTWTSGRPWEIIAAEARGHDVVVIGTRGHSPILHLPIGRTADRVVRTSPVPVLTIPAGREAPGRRPHEIIVPTDFSGAAQRALHEVVRVFGAPAQTLRITLLHAWQPLVEYGHVSMAIPPGNPCAESEEQASDALTRLAESIRTDAIDVRPVLRPGYPAKVIEDEAEIVGADLVAMGTHGHSGLARFMLGSVAEHVVHRVGCPVLTVGPAAGTEAVAEDTAHAEAG